VVEETDHHEQKENRHRDDKTVNHVPHVVIDLLVLIVPLAKKEMNNLNKKETNLVVVPLVKKGTNLDNPVNIVLPVTTTVKKILDHIEKEEILMVLEITKNLEKDVMIAHVEEVVDGDADFIVTVLDLKMAMILPKVLLLQLMNNHIALKDDHVKTN
jgi:hypothetical protein